MLYLVDDISSGEEADAFSENVSDLDSSVPRELFDDDSDDITAVKVSASVVLQEKLGIRTMSLKRSGMPRLRNPKDADLVVDIVLSDSATGRLLVRRGDNVFDLADLFVKTMKLKPRARGIVVNQLVTRLSRYAEEVKRSNRQWQGDED